MKATKENYKNLPLCPGNGNQKLYWADEPGLGIRCTAGRAFIVQGYVKGYGKDAVSRRITIGDVDTWDWDDAVLICREFRKIMDLGVDPRYKPEYIAQLIGDSYMVSKRDQHTRVLSRKHIKQRMTSENYESLPQTLDKNMVYWDENYSFFGLRIGMKSRSFIVQGRIKGYGKKNCEVAITIGNTRTFTYQEALNIAIEMMKMMRLGIDPREKKDFLLARLQPNVNEIAPWGNGGVANTQVKVEPSPTSPQPKPLKKIDLIGAKFGKLTVIERDKPDPRTGALSWLCECDCGNRKVIAGRSLKAGLTKSCGCIKRGRKPKEKHEPRS